MVGVSTIIAVVVTLLVTTLFPLGLYVIYGVKNKGKGVWSAGLFGAAGFFVMQVIIRMTILSIVAMLPGYGTFVMKHYILYCFILALTAALFEVVARVVVAKILSKDLTYEKGVAAGIGHGGIESIVIVGMTYVNNLIYIVMINTGAFDVLIEQTAAQGVDVSQLELLKVQLTEFPSAMFYLAGYERILTIILHIALSLLVCYFVWKKKTWIGVIICTLIHFLVDFIVPLINGMTSASMGSVLSQTTAYVIVYSLLTLVAIGSAVLIWKIKKLWKQDGELANDEQIEPVVQEETVHIKETENE